MVRRIYHHRWGGWGSNPRPADYENYGPVHRAHYLHGYHEAVPLMALIALVAPMARSTNRSTAKRSASSRPATGRNAARSARP
jgi:hypothetical protein